VKIVSIVGARPQFIKAAAVSRQLRQRHREILVHTGQHYDYQMSGIFFDGLEIPAPDVNLGVGSGPHGAQTGAMLAAIEEVLITERPDFLLVYGDTNSTLAGALAASKLGVPIVHVEAGLRSFNRSMPEEINRVVTDHLSDLLLCPSDVAVSHLATEGITRNVHQVGDVMLDVLNWAAERSQANTPAMLNRLRVTARSYLLATVHRGENTDDVARLSAIIAAFNAVDEPVLFPVHPRTRKAITAAGCHLASHIQLIDPLSYVDMTALTRSARLVLTDSGGLQKEAYWMGVPCVTLRDETEWVETVGCGWNRLVGSDTARIVDAVRSFAPAGPQPMLYGDGQAAGRCVELLDARPEPSGDQRAPEAGVIEPAGPAASVITEPPYFLHESAYVDAGAEVGEGSKIWHFSHVMKGARIGKRSNLGQNVNIDGGTIIGDNVKIQNNVSVYTGTVVEDDVFLGPSCVLTNVSNPRSQVDRHSLYEATRLRRGCTIGANATIVCGVTVGLYAFVGAGSVVTRDLPDYALVVGNPARQIGWISRHGHRLGLPDAFGVMRCPESGFRYQEVTRGVLRCLDLDEDAPLPETLSKGTKSHREFKEEAQYERSVARS
jgi:UDP-N-acetylglucosamine 2-epimerase